MNQSKRLFSIIMIGIFFQVLSACSAHSKNTTQNANKGIEVKMTNPVVYFEIPVKDMDRASKFYSKVFEFKFENQIIDNNEMALFPFVEANSGISGALAKGAIYKPTKDGVLIYFRTANIDETLKLVISNGGQILYPKTDNGIGLVAEFEDTEGNRIALYAPKE